MKNQNEIASGRKYSSPASTRAHEKRKNIWVGVALVAGVIVFSGCGGNNPEKQAKKAAKEYYNCYKKVETEIDVDICDEKLRQKYGEKLLEDKVFMLTFQKELEKIYKEDPNPTNEEKSTGINAAKEMCDCFKKADADSDKLDDDDIVGLIAIIEKLGKCTDAVENKYEKYDNDKVFKDAFDKQMEKCVSGSWNGYKNRE